MNYLPDNLQAITELLPEAQYAAALWLHDLQNQGLTVHVTEVYRTQERQNELYSIGRRGRPNERAVTWTRRSMHIQRLACDILAYGCTYEQVEKVARVYGIYRPKELVMLGDLGHFQFDRCIQEPQEPLYTPSAITRRFQRLIERANGYVKTSLIRRFSDFLSRS